MLALPVIRQNTGLVLSKVMHYIRRLGRRYSERESLEHDAAALAAAIQQLLCASVVLEEAAARINSLTAVMQCRVVRARTAYTDTTGAHVNQLETAAAQHRFSCRVSLVRALKWIDERIEECDTSTQLFSAASGFVTHLDPSNPQQTARRCSFPFSTALCARTVAPLACASRALIDVSTGNTLLTLPVSAVSCASNNVPGMFVVEHALGSSACRGDGLWEWRTSATNVFTLSCLSEHQRVPLRSIQPEDVVVRVCKTPACVALVDAMVSVTMAAVGTFQIAYTVPPGHRGIIIWVYVCGMPVSGCPFVPRYVTCPVGVRAWDWAEVMASTSLVDR